MLCLATATHHFKWMTITHACSIWDQTFVNLYVQALTSFPILWNAVTSLGENKVI